ncbi:unnamed protein product [Zymoseptoria tritici ST99CH_3D1]|uniref:E3 ubiquitin-protein ligase listerin n=1 Tax=Zymoseptoria tritici ST99CH_1E4 TaxID=1276532 RepID=A0A2H1GME6_ZYMTR|nr:unnamed protein product [Zymoseptoria tritici ST99CH_1E4]SMR56542.1 unnamed protein product [Zymoseptoria tritici ST99CH_3D1]
MSRKFKSQASSGRVGTFGNSGFGSTQSSTLSYIQEPLDYSGISDANVVVALKNLTKKDSTTKTKALEDLQAGLVTDNDISDALLETWVRLFPRLSIDNARRVRQLAHSLNGQLCAKCGKRVAKHLPKIAGAWLSGLFDNDRAAAKAAQDALSTVFPNQEKIQGLRKAFQEAILEYCRDALLNETAQTLSDERAVSVEDAQATHARVVSTSISVVSSLLEHLPSEEVAKQSYLYEAVFGDKGFWENAAHSDSTVRKALHRLVRVCLNKQPAFVSDNLKLVSHAFLYKALPSDQTGSSLDYAQTLHVLTRELPTAWTEAYTGKKPAMSRLRQCLKTGSYSGPPGFWDAMSNVFQILPAEVLPKSYDESADLLLAARDGVTRKEERFNASAAWPAYFTLVDLAARQLSSEDCDKILQNFAVPPISQYLQPSDETSQWNVTGAKAAQLVSKAAMVKGFGPLLEREWPAYADKLIESAKTSQPEQSKDFDKSQKHVATTGERWADLQRELYATAYDLPDSTRSVFADANAKILSEAIALLKTRNGKPYGAAAIVEQQLRTCSSELLRDQNFKNTLLAFLKNDMPSLVYSPAQRHLTRCLYAVVSESEFQEVFDTTLAAILRGDDTDNSKTKALHAFFPMNTPLQAVELARSSEVLQSFLTTLAIAHADASSANLFSDLMKLGVVASETSDRLLSQLTDSLSLSGPEQQVAITTFDKIASANQQALKAFMSSPNGAGEQLMPIVLRLEQSADDSVAEKAAALSSKLTSTLGSEATGARFDMILHNLEKVSSQSLPMDTVLELGSKVNAESGKNNHSLPNIDVFRRATIAVIKSPKESLGLHSPLGGAVHIVRSEPSKPSQAVEYDGEGLSQALRMSMYLASTIGADIASFSSGHASAYVALLSVCVLLVEDCLSIKGANAMWLPSEAQALEHEIMEFVRDAHAVLAEVSAKNEDEFFAGLSTLKADSGKFSPLAYYASLAAVKAHENIFELQGHGTDLNKSCEDTLRTVRASKDPLALTAYIVEYAQPLTGAQYLTRLCNELVADLTALDIEAKESDGLGSLVILNAILNSQDDISSTIAKNRMVFMVKHIIAWLELGTSLAVKAEVLKVLTSLLPSMSDMYGEHWAQVTKILISLWSASPSTDDDPIVSESKILVINASLRLYSALEQLTRAEEPNDDLVETTKENKDQSLNGLVNLLKSSSDVSDLHHQPLMITNELLARTLSKTSVKSLNDAEDLFPLLYAPSHAIQSATFTLLQKHIPAAQEQISFDAALENKTAQLPDELLSLIIEAPTLDTLADASFDVAMPLQLQGFLNSWRVLFEHFNGSSYRVKTDYVEQLKDGGYVSGLLSLTFDFLGHTRGRPVDASKFDVKQYTSDSEPNVERDVQWLLTHLYYLALTHLPSLVKAYVLDIRSRQTPQIIETWTAKYISPLTITSSLQEVADWAEKSVKDDPDYENMTVKVGMRSREVNVAYLVDEQHMAIKVVLPEAYPLDAAKVTSVNRVAVKEEKWQSWLRNCQGVITFSNGSITDALAAWRKNVSGTLKGQTECAICYSIISGAKELPTKRCQTCKNLFHASCLFKWFKSSNASTCPLCRNAFNFN